MEGSWEANERESARFFDRLWQPFMQMERDLDLYDRRIGGIQYWGHVRATVYARLRSSLLDTGVDSDLESPASRRGVTGKLRTALQAAKNVVWHNPYRSSDADILVFGSSRRKQLSDGNWWNIHYDHILPELRSKYVYFESSTSDQHAFHMQPAKTRHLRYLDLPVFLSGLKHNVSGDVTLDEAEQRHLESVENRIETTFGTSVGLTSLVRDTVSLYRNYTPFLKQILNRHDPAYVLTDADSQLLCRVCSDLGIPVVTVQTAVSNRRDPRYHFQVGGPTPTFGDYYLAWGEYWRTAADYPLPDGRIFSVGYPHQERERERYADVETRDQILFISQPTIGDRLSAFAAELAEMDVGWDIVYKLHPREGSYWETEYPWLSSADLDIASPRSGTLYELFAASRVVVGVNSTTMWECLGFDVRPFLVPLPGYGEVEFLLDNDLATVVDSPTELASHLSDEVSPVSVDETDLFEPNAMETFSDRLDWLVDNATTYDG